MLFNVQTLTSDRVNVHRVYQGVTSWAVNIGLHQALFCFNQEAHLLQACVATRVRHSCLGSSIQQRPWHFHLKVGPFVSGVSPFQAIFSVKPQCLVRFMFGKLKQCLHKVVTWQLQWQCANFWDTLCP